MKKLTLEHLAGYLPYGLKGRDHNGESIDISIITISHWTCGRIGITPYLHPLSDLTKEIEVGGEKFVAIDRINSLFPEYPLIKDSVCGINVFFISDSCELNMLSISEVYKIYQKLYSWHFDIHNLISEGLAIDINTI